MIAVCVVRKQNTDNVKGGEIQNSVCQVRVRRGGEHFPEHKWTK
jgi:hypothetical protein